MSATIDSLFEASAKDQHDWHAAIGFLTVSFSRVDRAVESIVDHLYRHHQAAEFEPEPPRSFKGKVKLVRQVFAARKALREEAGDPTEHLDQALRIARTRHWMSHGVPSDVAMSTIDVQLTKLSREQPKRLETRSFNISDIKTTCADCEILGSNLVLLMVYGLGLGDRREFDEFFDQIRRKRELRPADLSGSRPIEDTH